MSISLLHVERKALVIAAAIVISMPPALAHSQAASGQFGILAGATFPTGVVADELETGFNLGVTLAMISPAYPLALRFDASWHQLRFAPHEGHDSENLRVVAGKANLLYNATLPFRPFVIGGVGAYNLRDPHAGGDENEFGWNLGAGIRLALAQFETFAELRYHNIRREGGNLALMPFSFGIMF